MRTRYICHIPVSALEAATELQRQITGRPDDPPVFRLEQARGESARLFAHVWLWTEEQTQAFVAALPGIGGVVRQTYPQDKEVVSKVEALGRRRRPDLPLKTTPELVALAKDLGVTPTPQNREKLLQKLEEELTKDEL